MKDEMKTVPVVAAPPAAGGAEPVLRVSGLRKSFKMGESQVHVLRSVDLTIKRGEFLAIEGMLKKQ